MIRHFYMQGNFLAGLLSIPDQYDPICRGMRELSFNLVIREEFQEYNIATNRFQTTARLRTATLVTYDPTNRNPGVILINSTIAQLELEPGFMFFPSSEYVRRMIVELTSPVAAVPVAPRPRAASTARELAQTRNPILGAAAGPTRVNRVELPTAYTVRTDELQSGQVTTGDADDLIPF